MNLSPRLVAIQGIGFSAITLAVQGLIESVGSNPEPVVKLRSGVVASGPGTTLSLADYLRLFGQPSVAPVVSTPVHTSAQRIAQARKKRQRMEEEVFALADIF